MDTETIDLTDPLDEIFKQTNWTPECLSIRLSALAQENTNTKNNKKESITLNDLLSKCNDSNLSTNSINSEPDTIDLCGTGVCETSINADNGVCGDNENVTEVQVIELSDFSDHNSCSSDQNDDDDLFEEFSVGKSRFKVLNENYINFSASSTENSFHCPNKSPFKMVVAADEEDVFEAAKIDASLDNINLLHNTNTKERSGESLCLDTTQSEVCSRIAADNMVDLTSCLKEDNLSSSNVTNSESDIKPPLKCYENNSKKKGLHSTLNKLITRCKENDDSELNCDIVKFKSVDVSLQLSDSKSEGEIEPVEEIIESSKKANILSDTTTNIKRKISDILTDDDILLQFNEFINGHLDNRSDGHLMEEQCSKYPREAANTDTKLVQSVDANKKNDNSLNLSVTVETESILIEPSSKVSLHLSDSKIKLSDSFNKTATQSGAEDEGNKSYDDVNYSPCTLSDDRNEYSSVESASPNNSQCPIDKNNENGQLDSDANHQLRSDAEANILLNVLGSKASVALRNKSKLLETNKESHTENIALQSSKSSTAQGNNKTKDELLMEWDELVDEKSDINKPSSLIKEDVTILECNSSRISPISQSTMDTNNKNVHLDCGVLVSRDTTPETAIACQQCLQQNSDDFSSNCIHGSSKQYDTLTNYSSSQNLNVINPRIPGKSVSQGLTSTENTITEEHFSNPEEETTLERLEDLRNSLKRQLTSLRTKKKMDIMQDMKQTSVCVPKLPKSFNDLNSTTNNKDRDEKCLNIIRKDFKVSWATNAPEHEIENAVDSQENEDIPNVFNEIRKIIRKPKSFLVSNSVDRNLFKENNSGDKSTEQLLQEKSITKSDTLQTDHPASNNSKEGPKGTINSPFVSNSLDEFLIDSKLNVSYTIPKSGAEEGLRQVYSIEPAISYDPKVKDEDSKKPKDEIKYKPKTLAEKRRILEKTKIREQKRIQKLKVQEELSNRSYVLFKNKKILLQSKSMNKCIASIDSNMHQDTFSLTTFKKPSLLTELYRRTSTVKYRPGPLCKKPLLQSDYSQWTTELKRLPRVLLNVMPQLGKPVHQNLLPILYQWNGEITENQIEFALSAVVTKTKPNQQIFEFDVKYHQQQNELLVRRKNSAKPTVRFDNNSNNYKCSNPDEDIANVIDNLIKYVEIKEIASSVIRNEEDSASFIDETPIKAVEDLLNKNHTPIIKKKASQKLSRTSKELLRLNCKVVRMDAKESEPKIHCSKAFCRLGCLCKSLQCEAIIGLHCQKISCIFGCTCLGPTVSATFSSDFLSMDTVNRIEDRAKKNLAKEEREFTQTVIYAKDQTIVVGAGNKTRRAAKTPKKYTDFFEEDIFKEAEGENKKRHFHIKPCVVSLDKWDFSNIIPYCLVHYFYNCHCKGRSTLFSNNSLYSAIDEQQTKVKEDNQSPANQNNIIQKPQIKTKIKETSLPDDPSLSTNTDTGEPLYSVTGRPLRKKKSTFKPGFIQYNASDKVEESTIIIDPLHCSRTTEIHKKYRRVKQFTDTVASMDFANNITQADILKMKLNSKDMSECELLKNSIIEQTRKLHEIPLTDERKKHQRKQQIQVRQDEDLNINVTSKAVINKKSKRQVNSVFRGEIIVNDSEWLKKLCNNAKQPLDSYARILPWNALIKGFVSKSLNVYCICDMPLRLLLNVGEKLVGSKIVDIESSGHKILEAPLKGKAPWLVSQSENVRDIIKWLLSGTLASKYKDTSLSFLLVETLPGQFEVRGLCTQNENIKEKHEVGTVLPKEKEISDEITEIKHKNMNNEVGSMFITKCNFRLRELVEDGFDDDLTDSLYMWVGLPEVYRIAKWRVIFLKKDFVYLYFKNIKYSIKYTDLVKLTEMAKEENLTLLIRNLQIRRSYEHASFGLYVSPMYSDRIFLGPYFINYDEEDIETLKYMNESLISSESLNRMKGNPNYKCGHWMYERPYSQTPKKKETIDLTMDDIKVSPSAEKKLSTPPLQSLALSNEDQIINHNGFPVLIKNARPRAPSEFNRYIITNIPHFGYLGAFQSDNSSNLEVSWPFEKKVLQFENADHARDFLQERFNQLLQPVPETFKIQVIVLIHLDLNDHLPINSDFLSGHCICGYFGTYNFKELSDEFCKVELKTSKEEITKLFAKRAHDYIRKKISELAEIVGIDPNDNVNYNVRNILDKAKMEMKFQEQLRIRQVADIYSKENMVVANIRKLFEMIKKLPGNERNVESQILNEILKIRPKRFAANEVIEIKDDDNAEAKTNEKWKKIEIVYSKSSEEYTRGNCKRKKTNMAKNHKPKIAKVAPFSSSPVGSTVKLNQDISDKPDRTERLPTNTDHNIDDFFIKLPTETM